MKKIIEIKNDNSIYYDGNNIIDRAYILKMFDRKNLNYSRTNSSIPEKIFIIQKFNSDNIFPYHTRLQCPKCDNGSLVIKNKNSLEIRSYVNWNKACEEQDLYDDEFLKYKFAGYLMCDNDKCNEYIAISGDVKHSVYEIDEDTCCEEEKYIIKYIDDVKDFFDVSSLDDSSRHFLKLSFQLYFIDLPSCLNKIRSFLEKWITSHGIPETNTNGKNLSLEERIGKLKSIVSNKKYEYLQEILKLIKYVGNCGSHSEYSDLENCMSDIYLLIEHIIETDKVAEITEHLKKKFLN